MLSAWALCMPNPKWWVRTFSTSRFSMNWMTAISPMRSQVLQAVGLTAIVVIGLTIFAVQTKWDFTMMGGILFVFLILFVVVGLILGFTTFGRSNTGTLILSGFGALLFAVYLICKYSIVAVCFPHRLILAFSFIQTTLSWSWAANARIHWHQKNTFWEQLCSIWTSSICSCICWGFCQLCRNKRIDSP